MSNESPTFGGSIAQTYHAHLVPLLFHGFADEVAARVTQSGAKRVLDVAGGTGIVAMRLAAHGGEQISIVGTDISETMLDVGQTYLNHDPRITWRVADGCELPFESSEFDAVTCQFGLMFFPDPLKGLQEAKRVLRPGGTLHCVVWNLPEENALWTAVEEAFSQALPDETRPIMPTPFLMADPTKLRSMAESAGFSEISIEEIRLTHDRYSADQAATGFVFGTPMCHFLGSLGADLDEVKAQVVSEITAKLGDPFESELSAWLCVAKS